MSQPAVATRLYYLDKKLPEPSKTLGKSNLIAEKSFLPHLPGGPIHVSDEIAKDSSLRKVVHRQIIAKEIVPLPSMSSFRLYPGPLPKEYQYLVSSASTPHKELSKKEKKKAKKAKHANETPEERAERKRRKKEKKKRKEKEHQSSAPN